MLDGFHDKVTFVLLVPAVLSIVQYSHLLTWLNPLAVIPPAILLALPLINSAVNASVAIVVAEIPQKPGLLRVQLQQAVAVAKAAGTDDPAALAPNTATATTEFFLTLPRATAERAQLVAGQTITAEQRPYGLAFALVNTQTGQKSPFFLVLDDAWFRELESHPLGV